MTLVTDSVMRGCSNHNEQNAADRHVRPGQLRLGIGIEIHTKDLWVMIQFMQARQTIRVQVVGVQPEVLLKSGTARGGIPKGYRSPVIVWGELGVKNQYDRQALAREYYTVRILDL